MAYQGSIGGRVSEDGSGGGRLLSFEDVRGALVEAVSVHRRHSAGGYWPFAGDGPWHLYRHEAGDHGAHWAKPMPKVPPSRAELARMREVLEWLLLVPVDDDRRLVVLGIGALAEGHSRVPWSRLVEKRARWRTPDGLRMRFDRALAALTMRLNRAGVNLCGHGNG